MILVLFPALMQTYVIANVHRHHPLPRLCRCLGLNSLLFHSRQCVGEHCLSGPSGEWLQGWLLMYLFFFCFELFFRYPDVHHFKGYSSLVLGILTDLCSHHLLSNSSTFPSPQKETLYLFTVIPHSYLLPALGNH